MNEPTEIYIAYSRAQDECTVCNRWFDTYADAWKYAQQVEKESGCILHVIRVRRGTEKDLQA